ncbi:MBL fold metallo-hydrolase [Shouchella shacheensis]|uniref:MBL fold metallo-hydrolase n=1 Tax=Shouchella shacheensis TaxID=1649580 RepID=UPI00073FCFD7|nr:MBL fold metallo-hydrolase [Shouchella shacheensis]
MRRKRYENLDGIRNHHSVLDFLRWFNERRRKEKDLRARIEQVESPVIHELRENRTATSITWIGHATFLIQQNGLNLLTDPVWARKIARYRRATPPGLPLDELPGIDAVLLSHGHYDHLDFATLKQLKGKPMFYVPAGMKRLFTKRGYKNVQELQWWKATTVGGLTFSFVPAQHWVRRGVFDQNASHWGGWMIEGAHESIYFAGDSGYFRGFAEIGQRYQPDIALLPIGAYEPEWFMKLDHMNPEEAICAFRDLGADVCIPMHYGTFRLADETGIEARDRFLQGWEKQRLAKERLAMLKIGETLWL